MVGLGCVAGYCLAPDGLNPRAPTVSLSTHLGETSATPQGVGSKHTSPSPQTTTKGGREIVHMRPCPPSHDRMGQRTRCQSCGCHIVLDDVNTFLLQHAPNRLNILLVHAGNTNAAIDIAVTVLNDLELKRDTVQTKDDFPAQ